VKEGSGWSDSGTVEHPRVAFRLPEAPNVPMGTDPCESI